MLKYSLLSLLLIFPVLSADTVTLPDPPACLTKPVTQGNITLSCSMIDNTGSFGADPGLFSGGVQYVLQVRITSSDPDVLGIRVTVTSLIDSGTPAAPALVSVMESRSLSKTCSSQPPAVAGCGPNDTYVYRYSLVPGSPLITSIQIQELKASTSQTF
jgi:hypothetical protein